ncbi:hypothetical protein BDZ89DRAFT_1017650 [Hymenopellis radicata]|nr:hypothetical protein BDZ89DRAFT_1017650 [Hymenopellis radicata]
MAVSGTFHANADHNRTLGRPDIVLSSRDHVLFYAHTRVLDGAFSSIPASSPVPIPESSGCVNILLHTLYNLPAEQYNYPLEALLDAIEKMSRYGIDPKAIIVPSNALYRLLTLHVPYQPLFVYAVAGHFSLENLAVQISGHLLTIELESISEDLAVLMGTSYYLRLFLLHENRMEALQRILNEYPEPPPHNPCNALPVSEGKTAWIDAGLDMITNDVKPSLSPQYMRGCIIPFARSITCVTCATVFENRLTAACQEWSQIKCTI